MKGKMLSAVGFSVVTGIILLFSSAHAQDGWVSISGTVVDSSDESFRLDYGEGLVTVEMDDWDWFQQGDLALDGEQVTVTGRINADLLEKSRIEADSVHVKDLNTYYYASETDEDIDPYIVSSTHSIEKLENDSRLTLTGTVTKVDGREFALDTGDMNIRVDTIGMGYNPLDNIGFQQIDKGDKVSVNGKLDLDFFEEREVIADSILTLNRDIGKSRAERQEAG